MGALIVSAAASGYGVAPWVSGIKITKSLLWIVLGLQLVFLFGYHESPRSAANR